MTVSVGLALRPYAGVEDIGGIVRIVNADSAADGVEEVWTEEGAAAWFGHPTEQFDARRDVVIGELDGRIVAAGGVEWLDTRDGLYREYRFWGVVDPELRGRGIGSALLADNQRRAAALAASHAMGDRRPVLGSFAAAGRPAEALLRASGYEVERWFFDMVRPTLDDVVEAPLPEGLELRPVTAEQHATVWRANREAFRDHWGGSDESLDAMHRLLDDPDTDTDLWLVAWDGDEVAGGIWNGIRRAENEQLGMRRGWLDSVFTGRAWRKRGLARSLIGRSLLLLKERGMTSAALGVDADNANGALGMYEAAGFAVHERFTAWRRPMEVSDR
jgi:mycothiol synthase